MNAHMDSELETFRLLQPLIQVSQCIEDTQTRSYSSVCVIFMCLGIAKVDEEPVTKQLGDMSIKACDDLGADPLIRTDDFAILFGVELGREFGGFHQITEHDGELAAFSFWWTRFC